MNLWSASIQVPSRAPARRGFAVGLAITMVAGCGRSDRVAELPEAAKNSLIQKKVDARPRSSPARPSRR